MQTAIIIGFWVLVVSVVLTGVALLWADIRLNRVHKRLSPKQMAQHMADAQFRVRQLFRDSNRRMDRISGKQDPFDFGPDGGW